MNHIGFHHQVFVNEFGGVGVVGVNTSHLSGGQHYVVWFFGLYEVAYGLLITQVQRCVGAGTMFFLSVWVLTVER